MKQRVTARILILFLFLVIITLGYITIQAMDSTQLIILHTNDTHGHPLKFSDNSTDNVAGLPARATLVSQIRAENPLVLLLDAGDINTGRPESNFFKAESDIKGLNYLKYDAVVFGNHEFDNPLPILKKQMTEANFPFLGANVKTKSGKFIANPYIIKKYKGFKVAIFGLTTSETASVGNPEVVKDLQFADEIETAKILVPELHKKADIVIALVHMGIYSDDEHGSKRLAKYVPGIDLIIDGHSHTNLTQPIIINQTPIVQAWQWGFIVGKAVMTIEKKHVTHFNWETIPVNLKTVTKKADGSKEFKFIGTEIPEDPKLLGLLQPYADEVDKLLAEPVGISKSLFSNANSRLQETAIGDLISDSINWFTQDLKVDFAIQNGGGIRTDLPEGTITKKTIYSILPFDNSVVVVTLKGSDLQGIFNYIATIPQGAGSFPQVSDGVTFTINYTKGTCENIMIHNQPLNPEKLYRVATNSYMAIGGDGYQGFLKAVDKYDTSAFQRDVLIQYLIHLGGTIQPDTKGRIQIIGNKLATTLKELKLAA